MRSYHDEKQEDDIDVQPQLEGVILKARAFTSGPKDLPRDEAAR
jgi:hypothetical protein